MTAISTYVELAEEANEGNDWFRGMVDFPILPPIGSQIRVMDRNAKMRDLRVVTMRINGQMTEPKLPLHRTPRITLICSELSVRLQTI